MATKINDFGEKIGGARKDVWKIRGLDVTDLEYLNDKEIEKYVVKNQIWKKPDYQAMVNEGTPVRVAYFMKRVRDSLISRPAIFKSMEESRKDQIVRKYIEYIKDMRDAVNSIQSEQDVEKFYENHILNKYVHPYGPSSMRVSLDPNYMSLFENKTLKAVQLLSWNRIDFEINKKQFCFSDEQKKLDGYSFIRYDDTDMKLDQSEDKPRIEYKRGSSSVFYYPSYKFEHMQDWQNHTYFVVKGNHIIENNFPSVESAKEYTLNLVGSQPEKKVERKKGYVPKQLQHIKNEQDYRKHMNVKGEHYLNQFGFRGGEFGNWMGEADRQYSLNYGYDALMDLSYALKIDPKDISLDHQLAIAFGARGKGSAVAHYEPEREVINLTKMKGAGSLAHEWGHALDDIAGQKLDGDLLTSRYMSEKFSYIKTLMDTMKYKTVISESGDSVKVKTDFYENSCTFNDMFTKEGHGYWNSDVEMFARAFACYVKDQLGWRSDYLCGHADSIHMIGPKGDLICAYPVGEERAAINQCFSNLIHELKQANILHEVDDFKQNLKSEITDIQQTSSTIDNEMIHVEYTIPSCTALENVREDFNQRIQDMIKNGSEPFLLSISTDEECLLDQDIINLDIAENITMISDWKCIDPFQEYIEWKQIDQGLDLFDQGMMESETLAIGI